MDGLIYIYILIDDYINLDTQQWSIDDLTKIRDKLYWRKQIKALSSRLSKSTTISDNNYVECVY